MPKIRKAVFSGIGGTRFLPATKVAQRTSVDLDKLLFNTLLRKQSKLVLIRSFLLPVGISEL